MKKEQFIRNMIIAVLLFLTFWFGIRPIITGEEFQKRSTIVEAPYSENQYGLVVFGCEPEGITAALAASRMGLKTLLVTEEMDPGSYIKSGLITYTSPDYAVIDGQKKKLNTGIYTEFFGDTGGSFSPEDYIHSVKKMMDKEPNLQVLYNAGFLSVNTEENLLVGVSIYHNGEKKFVEAPVFIDATEDGKVLSMCNVPYFTGSGDINVVGAYMPVVYNFIISNVKWQDIESIRKQNQNMEDFQSVLEQYERYSKKTKISALSFIGQADDNMVISGIRMRQVNVYDPSELKADLNNALTEAKMLTAFLKVAFVPFENCTFRTGPQNFYIPEYRHFEGRYRLSVEDILENRSFPSKVVMASAPVDAEKFVNSDLTEEYTYILGSPKVYSIPLECFISENLDNLLMVGKKSSFSSLASTSAGRMAVSITSGEAMGVTAAFCFMNEITPLELSDSSEETIKKYQNLLRRSGITLMDFDEPNPNREHWAWEYVKVLAGYGLVAGGPDNDYLMGVEAYEENLAILIMNMVAKVIPEKYTLDLDARLRTFLNKKVLTGERACELLLEALNIPYTGRNAFQAAVNEGLIPHSVQERISPDNPVTLDCVYALTVKIVEIMGK